MITPTKGTRFFQRQNIRRLFDHAKQVRSARSVRADFTNLFHGKEPTTRTGSHGLAGRRDRTGNTLRLIPARLHHPQRNAFRGARPDSWHLPQLDDQVPDRRRVFRFPQDRRPLVIPGGYRSTARPAARAGGDTAGGGGPLPLPDRARSEIANRPQPTVFPDKAQRHSRMHRAG